MVPTDAHRGGLAPTERGGYRGSCFDESGDEQKDKMNVALYPELRSISLCAGVGMLDLGVRLALPRVRTVCYVEREITAAQILVSRIKDGLLCDSPIWDCVTTFDGKPWRGLVQMVVAGFPCQPFSVAGAKAGTDDDRFIFHEIIRIVKECGAEIVFLENVPGLISTRTILHRPEIADYIGALDALIADCQSARTQYYAQNHRDRLYRRLLRKHGISALHYVCCELESAGYRVECGIFSAEEMGATHLRKRLFILAHRNGERQPQPQRSIREQREWTEHCGESVADTESGVRFSIAHNRTRQSAFSRKDVADDNDERRRAESIHGRSTKQRTRPQSSGSSKQLADARRERLSGWGITGNISGSQGEVEEKEKQRQRNGHATDDSEFDVVDATGKRARSKTDEPDPFPTGGNSRPESSVGREQELADSEYCRRKGRQRAGCRSDATLSSGEGRSELEYSISAGSQIRRPADDDANIGSGRHEHLTADQRPEITEPSRDVGVAHIAGLQGRRRLGRCVPEFSAWPPGPTDRDAWERIIAERPDLAPAISKETEPEVCGMADGTTGRMGVSGVSRADQLRILGNGVVAVTAAYAFTVLAEKLGLKFDANTRPA